MVPLYAWQLVENSTRVYNWKCIQPRSYIVTQKNKLFHNRKSKYSRDFEITERRGFNQMFNLSFNSFQSSLHNKPVATKDQQMLSIDSEKPPFRPETPQA